MNRNRNRNGLRRVTEQTPVTDAIERDKRTIRLHVDYLRRTGATETTLHHRRENLRRLAQDLDVDLLDATPDDLDDWQSRTMRRVSLSSVSTYTSHCRALYQWALEAGHIDADPSIRLARTRVPARSPRPIPTADLELALACAQGDMYVWLVLGAFMGLRAGEIVAIKRDDLGEGIVDGERRHFLSGVGKGGKPYRLPIPVDVVPVLIPLLRGKSDLKSGQIFRNSVGTPTTRPQLTNAVSAFFHRLEMPWTMHNLRHTYGTLIQQETGDMLQTQVLMRHANLNTTRLYVEPVQAPGVRAMDKLARRLRVRPNPEVA